jgi:NAD(P)-dependent dehydrogenase (short-subunit alcohol dehydrogenase family)
MSKAALNMLVQVYAAETATTAVRVNAFNPGPTRTRMFTSGWPGVDPDTLPAPEEVVKAIVPLCLPSCGESGKLYDYPQKKFLAFHPPA